MKFLYCKNCNAKTQHIVFCSQVQCQGCGQGNKKPASKVKETNNSIIPKSTDPIPPVSNKIWGNDYSEKVKSANEVKA